MKYIILLIVLLLSSAALSAADCPQDEKDLLINTQEKYDNVYLNYPNCREFTIIKHNGRFIGDPRYDHYALLLLGMMIGILIALKILFKYIRWFD